MHPNLRVKEASFFFLAFAQGMTGMALHHQRFFGSSLPCIHPQPLHLSPTPPKPDRLWGASSGSACSLAGFCSTATAPPNSRAKRSASNPIPNVTLLAFSKPSLSIMSTSVSKQTTKPKKANSVKSPIPPKAKRLTTPKKATSSTKCSVNPKSSATVCAPLSAKRSPSTQPNHKKLSKSKPPMNGAALSPFGKAKIPPKKANAATTLWFPSTA